jgi:hypothetical protein
MKIAMCICLCYKVSNDTSEDGVLSRGESGFTAEPSDFRKKWMQKIASTLNITVPQHQLHNESLSQRFSVFHLLVLERGDRTQNMMESSRFKLISSEVTLQIRYN